MKLLSNQRKFEYFVGTVISLMGLIVYSTTLSRSINFIDSGELATVAGTLGIAHPTGYPLFTLFGWIFSHLPLGMRVIHQLNFMSAIFCALALFFFFQFLVLLIKNIFNSGLKGAEYSDNQVSGKMIFALYLPAAFGTFTLAFSATYWSQALSIEVYSLHVFLISVILYLFTKAAYLELAQLERKNGTTGKFYWIGFAFILGLSFTNHMTTILLAPGFLFLYFYSFGWNPRSWKQLISLSIPFLIGFSVYLYLPLRASQHPLMNWGNPIDLEKWIWHFSGKVYRVWIFSSTESAAKQMNYFLNTLPDKFVVFPLGFSLIGIWSLWKLQKRSFYFTVLLFTGCVLYSINYDIHDIDSYFLLAYFIIAAWAGIGVYQICKWIKNKKHHYMVYGLLTVSIWVMVIVNYERVDVSDHSLVENYTKDMLNSIEPNGLVISYQWDYFVSASYYLQLIEKYRPDVVVIDKELLRRSWYFVQLNDRYPWLIEQSKKEVGDLLAELQKFEHNKPYNSNMIEYCYSKMIIGIIEKNYQVRPIYVTPEIEEQYTSGFIRVPSGLAFRLYKEPGIHKFRNVDFNYNIPHQKNNYVDGVISLYARAYLNNAIYLQTIGDKERAAEMIEKAIRLQPAMREAFYVKELLSR